MGFCPQSLSAVDEIGTDRAKSRSPLASCGERGGRWIFVLGARDGRRCGQPTWNQRLSVARRRGAIVRGADRGGPAAANTW